MDFSTMNLFDIVVLVIFMLFIVRGAWVGLIRQLATFAALIGGYLLAARFSGEFKLIVEPFIENPKLAFLASFALLFCFAAFLFILAGVVLRKLVELSLLGWFDRLVGMVLGGVQAWIICCFLYMFLSSSLSGNNTLLNSSVSGPFLAQGSEFLGELIKDSEIKEVFKENKPAIPLKEEIDSGQAGTGEQSTADSQKK